MKKKLYGYVTSQKFGNFLIPIPFQNIILNDYAKKQNFQYHLPSTELVINDFYLSLFSTIKKMDKSTLLCMCSILMLPMEEKKLNLFFKILIEKKIKVHCVYEKVVLSSLEDYNKEIKNYNIEKSLINIKEFI